MEDFLIQLTSKKTWAIDNYLSKLLPLFGKHIPGR